MLGTVLAVTIGAVIGGVVVGAAFNNAIREGDRVQQALRQEVGELRFSRDYWQENFYIQEQIKLDYQLAYKELMREKSNKPKIDENIREAIKFAMINSHPDKPSGDRDKFMKFHELYKKHCK